MDTGEVLKKYEKVESFLKRSLSHERYSEVRLIEPCVAISKHYNKLFKFVVLATDRLYVTENPPKNVKDIEEVTKIEHITSVELLNDVPDFLGGDLKYRAHHILITYNDDIYTHEHYNVDTSQTTPDLTTTAYTSLKIPNNAIKNDSGTFLRRLSTEDMYDETEKEFLEKGKSRKHRPLPSLVPFTSENKELPLHHSFSSLDDLKQRNNIKSIRLTSSASAVDLKTAKDENRLTKSFSGTTLNSSTKEKGLLASLQDFQKRRKERKASQFLGDEKKSVEFSTKDGGGNILPEENEKSCRIDFYMLLDKTVMLAYLRSTWDNCLLNAVLKQNKEGRSPNSIAKNKTNRSSMIELFDQLKNEITSSTELKNMFVLINELLTASKKNVLVKKLFWQSPDLFVFMVDQLKSYANSLASRDTSRVNKADELDSMLLFLECLSGMFRETELLAARMRNLRRDKCAVLNDLIHVTVSSPETKIAKIVRPPQISEAAELLLTGRHRAKKVPKEKTSHDIELEYLSSELTKNQVNLLHELFIIAYEAVWFPTDDNKLNICWMVKVVESSPSVLRFLKCFVQQIMNLMKLAENEDLSSENTTLLYRLFSVIKTILKQSKKLRKHVQEYYMEEFRYYVKLHTLTKCLPKDFPLTCSTLKLVEDVVHLVTSNDRRRTAR